MNWLNIWGSIFILSLVSKSLLNCWCYFSWWNIEWRKLIPIIIFDLIFYWRWFLIIGWRRVWLHLYVIAVSISQIWLDVRRRRFELTDSRFTISFNVSFIGWELVLNGWLILRLFNRGNNFRFVFSISRNYFWRIGKCRWCSLIRFIELIRLLYNCLSLIR